MSIAFQEESFPDEVMHCFGSMELAGGFLAGLAQGAPAVKAGPVRLGSPDLINSPEGVALVAATYRAAFQNGIKCYPYFTDR
jgi:hypothetical protein